MMWPGEPGQMRLLVSNLVVSLSVNVARGGIFAWGFHTSFEIQFLIAVGIVERNYYRSTGNDSNLLIVFYVQIMPDDFVMQLHRF